MQVKAWGSVSFNFNETLYLSQTAGGSYSIVHGIINSNTGGNGSINNGTGVISSISGGGGSISSNVVSSGATMYHFKVPLNMRGLFSDVGVTPSHDLYIDFLINFGTITVSSPSYGDLRAENIAIYNQNNKLLGAYKDSLYWVHDYVACDDIWEPANFGGYFSYPFILEFDVACGALRNFDNVNSCTLTWSGNCNLSPATAEQVAERVNDSGTQSRLDTQISQETTAQNTRTGILNQITSFFGSFFENIINALKSLFIPEDGYFTDWFTRLNTLLSAKLGMLYAPFDLVISVLTALGSASTSEAGIPFPELAWDGQVIIPAQTFYFSSLGSSFNDLRDAVYFGTDVVLLFAFLVLLQRKINLVMRGSEEG